MLTPEQVTKCYLLGIKIAPSHATGVWIVVKQDVFHHRSTSRLYILCVRDKQNMFHRVKYFASEEEAFECATHIEEQDLIWD